MNLSPILSPGFLDWIRSNDFSNSTILELGSGGSTLFFANYFKQVHSFEHNEKFLDEMKLKIPFNVNIQLFDKNLLSDYNFKNKVINCDVILIDNCVKTIPREEVAFFVHNNKNPNSIIILDNGDWNYHAYEFLRAHYYCFDFLRKDEREDFELTQTTVFYHPRNRN